MVSPRPLAVVGELRRSAQIGQRNPRAVTMGGGEVELILARRSLVPIAALAIPVPGFCMQMANRRLGNRGGSGAITMTR